MMRLFLLFFCVASLFGCHTLRPKQARQELTFEHSFRGKPFALNTPYVTLLGDTVMFTKLKYYISHVNWSGDKENYYLVDVEQLTGANATLSFPTNEKNSTSALSFGIGIDSVRNKSGEQKGVLDPLQGMFWTWEDGYVFLKAEGYFSPNSPKRVSFVLHVGKNENYIPLAYPAEREQKNTVFVEVEKLFGGFEGAGIDLKHPTKPLSIMAGERARGLKKNIFFCFFSQKI